MKKIHSLYFAAMMLFSTAFLAAQGNQGTPSQNNGSSVPNASNQIQWLSDYAQAISQSASSSKPIVILFTGTGWCPACMKLEREVLKNPEFTNAVAQKFIFLKADFPDYSEDAMMSSVYKPLMDRYHVNAFPTIVVIDAGGQKLYTVNYQTGGARVYAQELLQKLNSMGPPAVNTNQGYYRQ